MLKSAFEWAETGPNAGEPARDAPSQWKPRKLKYSTYGEEGSGIASHELAGNARTEKDERGSRDTEKDADLTLYHGSPEKNDPSIKQRGLMPQRANPRHQLTDVPGGKARPRSKLQRRSVHLADNPYYAAQFGAHGPSSVPWDDQKPRKEPNLYAIRFSDDEVKGLHRGPKEQAYEKGELSSDVSDVYLHEGSIKPGRLTPVRGWSAVSDEARKVIAARKAGQMEKGSDYDGPEMGDPTKLMPRLRQIHKLGDATSLGIEDLDAYNQSPGRVRPRQISRAMENKPAAAGPGYNADEAGKAGDPAEQDQDSGGEGGKDVQITEQPEEESTKNMFRKLVKGMGKQAILEGEDTSELEQGALRKEAVGFLPGMGRIQQAMNLERAMMETIYRGGEMSGREPMPMALALAGQQVAGGAQYARLVNADVDNVNRRLMMGALGKRAQAEAQGLPEAPGHLRKIGYKLQGHTDVQGLPIAIENRKGSVRKGTDSDGNEWRTEMKHPYGYIKGSKGADGEEVDAYVGPDKDAPAAFVVHQHKDTGKGYDEDKVMLGFRTKRDAKKAYLAHYDDPKFLGPMVRVSLDRLKALVASKKKLVKISQASWAGLLQEMDRLEKLAAGVAAPAYQKQIAKRFDRLTAALETHGQEIGTGHKRILIPKKLLSESDITKELGFVPVKIGIPEAGQTRFESFRHPDKLQHLHEHGDAWTMHRDEHPASTMLIHKWKKAREALEKAPGQVSAATRKAAKGSFLKPLGETIKGLPHVITEGVPGAYYYLAGRLRGADAMRSRLEAETPKELTQQLGRWKELKKAAAAKDKDDKKAKLMELARKAGPGIGGAIGAAGGALVGLKRGGVLKHTLGGLGAGATLGWTPDMYHSAREGIEKYRSGA